MEKDGKQWDASYQFFIVVSVSVILLNIEMVLDLNIGIDDWMSYEILITL